MNKTEIQNIVKITIGELRKQGLLKDEYSVILKELEPELKKYFNEKNDKIIECLLHKYSNDPYIEIIYLHYRDNVTMERIAEYMGKDVSTIKRNKKRLISNMYRDLREVYI